MHQRSTARHSRKLDLRHDSEPQTTRPGLIGSIVDIGGSPAEVFDYWETPRGLWLRVFPGGWLPVIELGPE